MVLSALTISLIQTALHWEDKDANLQMFDNKIANIKERTELVILPEMFSTGFSMQPEELAEGMDGNTVLWMKHTAARRNIILAGSVIIEEDGHFFNRFLWVLPNGQTGHYDKRHLFAYAREEEHYTAGNKKLIAQVNGWKVCPIVCYDLRFPVWIRQDPDSNKQYDLLICVADWPESRSLAWNALLQARAIENQCYVAGVNCIGVDGNGITYSGDSCIIDPMGNIIAKENKTETIITHTIGKEVVSETRNRFPFLNDADNFKFINV